MATVYVWLPGDPQKTNFFHGISGHISIATTYGYYSFWPGRKGGRENIGLIYPTPAFFDRQSVSEDEAGMEYDVDLQTTITGLDERAMDREWNIIKDNATKYKLLDTNCCTVSGRLLHVGFVNTAAGKDALNGKAGRYLKTMLNGTVKPSLTSVPGMPPSITPSVMLFYAELISNAIAGYPQTEDEVARKVQQMRDEKNPVLGFIGQLFRIFRKS